MKNLKTLKSKTLLLTLALSAASALAQGKVKFDWVGTTRQGGPIQASLVLDASLVYPGSVFWPGADEPEGDRGPSGEATGLIVTTPDHSWPQDGLLISYCNPFAGEIGYSHFDASGQLILSVSGRLGSQESALQVWNNTISDQNNYSTGYWQETIVPEPSTFTLFGLGLLALYMKKAASR
jgi:hypothetical protein